MSDSLRLVLVSPVSLVPDFLRRDVEFSDSLEREEPEPEVVPVLDPPEEVDPAELPPLEDPVCAWAGSEAIASATAIIAGV